MSDRWNPSREEVIEGLKKVWDAFDHMEHELYADYVFDALKMLKAQEPRVLTLEEVESSEDSVWLEKNIPEFEPMPVLVNETSQYLDTFISRSGWKFQGEKSRGYGEYGKTWRCWSSRPTDEQREATPWTE